MNKKVMFGIVILCAALVAIVTVKTVDTYHFITHDQYMPPLESFPQPRTNAPVMETTTVTQSRALVLSLAIFCAGISIVVLCHL